LRTNRATLAIEIAKSKIRAPGSKRRMSSGGDSAANDPDQ
jgi:hypothetical protein